MSSFFDTKHGAILFKLASSDGRYAPELFLFISEAIAKTVEWIHDNKIQQNDNNRKRSIDGDDFHVSGKELLAGIRKLATIRWGFLAKVVFEHWGVYKTEDFGTAVFLMVNCKELSWKKRDSDTIDDFENGYSFAAAFNPWSEDDAT